MEIVKIRRVGNSNILSVPRTFVRGGYDAGQPVVIDQLETGELIVRRVKTHREALREVARKVARKRQGLLDKLAAHDRGEEAAQAPTAGARGPER